MIYDLLVIGSGVLGTFHADHAAERGLKVAVLEKNGTPQDATVRNFGQIVPSGMDPEWQLLGRRSLEIYHELQSQFDISAQHHGSIYVASDQEELTLLEELATLNEAVGYRSELWNPKQCRRHYPNFNDDYCQGALFFPDEISVNPRLMITRLHQFMRDRKGVTFHYRHLATDIAREAGGVSNVSCTNGQKFQAENVLICSGSEFQLLYPDLFLQSEIELVKLQMLRLKPQLLGALPGNILTGLSIRRYESFADCPSYQKTIANQPPDSFAKKWGIHILFKQESDGGIILGDSHEYAPASHPDDLDFDLRDSINRFFISEGQKIMHLSDWDIETAWSGLYSQTKEPGGIFRRSPEERIHIATGIGGKGMTGSAGFAEKNLNTILL